MYSYSTMETMSEIIPFAKEMFNQKPSRGMVKMYLLGTTLAVFGAVGVLVETVCLPFSDQEPFEAIVTELITEKKKQMLEPEKTNEKPDVVVVEEVVQTEIQAKAKQVQAVGQRSMANRSHAS